MKSSIKLISLLLLLSALVGCFAACGETPAPEFVDYVANVKFDPNSGRANVAATVKTYIDGDTTHFNVPASVSPTGVLKARYLGINTPESTGQIEPWGKKASDYTKATLSKATSIMIESETDTWNPDSTGDRYLVWVWYKTDEMSDYRCLNMEILQQGLAIASKFSDTVYADVCNQILDQAVAQKLYVFSNEKDPDFYYGSALPITLKELKANIENYKGKSVSFDGVVARVSGQTAYVEEYDEESGLYFGVQVYFGYNLDYDGKEILKAGNRVRVIGSVQYYEEGGTYQISDIKYDAYFPSDKDIALISKGQSAAYQTMEAKDLVSGKTSLVITTIDEEGNEIDVTKEYDIGFLTMHSTVSVNNLTIKDVYTTTNESSASKGAMTITCMAEDGTEIIVRTIVLLDSSGNKITADTFPVGSVIDVKGLVDVYDGEYQVKLLSINNVTFHEASN